MRRALPLLLALALVGAASAGPEEAGTGSDVHKAFNELYPVAFRVKVNEAIDRGVQWLLTSQREDGSWNFFSHHRDYPMGSTALAALTLLKCGVKPDHPVIVKAFDFLRWAPSPKPGEPRIHRPMRRTYSVAVLLMALDAKYAPARDPFAVEHFDRYGNRRGDDPCAKKITPEDRTWMEEGVAFLLEHQKADGYWRYPSGGFDTSNTQFALLGLHAATRCGVKIKQRVWLDALRFMLDFQDKEGEAVMYKANEVRGRYRFEWMERAIARGFKYTAKSSVPSASMTSAGLTCLVICQNRLWRARPYTGQLRANTRRAIRDAMAWLQTHFAVDHNPGGHPHWTFYNLYGLERAGVLGRYRFLGEHDWYEAGAQFLFTKQDPKGFWHTGKHWEGSCFALLFLKRATSRMDAPVLTPSGSVDGEMPEAAAPKHAPPDEAVPATRTAHAVAVARAIKDLESRDPDVVFMAARRLGLLGHLRAVKPLVRVVKLHADPDARVAAANALGDLKAADAVPALIDALDDRDVLVRFAAELSLRKVTNLRPESWLRQAASKNDRIRLQRTWRAWWSEHEGEVRKRLKQPRSS